MKHELKCHPHYFQMVIMGVKPFECRFNDRNYQVGDEVVLKEYMPDVEVYTGREWHGFITYILSDFAGLKDGWVVFGLRIN